MHRIGFLSTDQRLSNLIDLQIEKDKLVTFLVTSFRNLRTIYEVNLIPSLPSGHVKHF